MTGEHVRVMLDALLAVPVPDGYSSAYRERHDAVIDTVYRDVVISPDGLDVSTFDFDSPDAYAHISVNDDGDTYTVGVFTTDVAYHVQSAGHVVAFPTAHDAVACAISEIQGALRRQERGW